MFPIINQRKLILICFLLVLSFHDSVIPHRLCTKHISMTCSSLITPPLLSFSLSLSPSLFLSLLLSFSLSISLSQFLYLYLSSHLSRSLFPSLRHVHTILDSPNYYLLNICITVSKMECVLPIFKLWTLALHSSSMSFKLLSFTLLSNLITSLKEAIMDVPILETEGMSNDNNGSDKSSDSVVQGVPSPPIPISTSHISTVSDTNLHVCASSSREPEEVDNSIPQSTPHNNTQHPTPHTTHSYRSSLLSTLSACICILPVHRLMSTAAKRLWHEMEDFPSYSRYVQVCKLILIFPFFF